jgi:hypothetical protein
MKASWQLKSLLEYRASRPADIAISEAVFIISLELGNKNRSRESKLDEPPFLPYAEPHVRVLAAHPSSHQQQRLLVLATTLPSRIFFDPEAVKG